MSATLAERKPPLDKHRSVNAPVESFFDSLKTELDPEALATHDGARRAVFEYIEVFYNRQRRHSAHDDISPSDFERQLDQVA